MNTATGANPRVLVAGIGNIFLGDDAFGVEVARQLSQRPLPAYVRVADYGIRGLDLAYALLDDYELVILVDAMARGGDPGTVYLVEPELNETGSGAAVVDAHGMNPMRVLEMVRALGGRLRKVLVVGCEPQTLGDEFEGAMGLSDCVTQAIAGAIAMIESLVAGVGTEYRADVMVQEFQEEEASHGTYTSG